MPRTRTIYLQEVDGKIQLMDQEIHYPIIAHDLPVATLWEDFVATANSHNWLQADPNRQMHLTAEFELQPRDFLMKKPILQVVDHGATYRWDFTTGAIQKP